MSTVTSSTYWLQMKVDQFPSFGIYHVAIIWHFQSTTFQFSFNWNRLIYRFSILELIISFCNFSLRHNKRDSTLMRNQNLVEWFISMTKNKILKWIHVTRHSLWTYWKGRLSMSCPAILLLRRHVNHVSLLKSW